MSTLKLTFTIDKLNIILAGLGELPAKISQSVILKIQDEAKKQIKPVENQVDPKQEISFELVLEEVNLILGGLGELPAKISMSLIQEVRSIAQKQVDESGSQESVVQTEEANSEHKIEEKLEHKPTHIDISTHEQN